ncbi:hypothetical protein A7E78_02520 [Syntrophotalea acetylenivorans]|uniref:Uncharacterized protein n=2 Tax=Syntrophotalea acetylenivorans TaxID=1842532 RepID=A0A1L3GT00_9BACT|nr:hypothetical protein A7E78_02520 [Syntrophotalea acetylenivorans]
MGHITSRLKHELVEAIPAAVFFFIAFQVIAFTQALMLRQYGIQVSTFVTATIAALVVAKVVLLADLLPFMSRFRKKPLIFGVLWKTIIYMIAALLVSYIEQLLHFVREHGDLARANRHLLDEVVWPHFWAIQIWLLIIFLVFCSLRELIRILGRERMARIFFGPSGTRVDQGHE